VQDVRNKAAIAQGLFLGDPPAGRNATCGRGETPACDDAEQDVDGNDVDDERVPSPGHDHVEVGCALRVA